MEIVPGIVSEGGKLSLNVLLKLSAREAADLDRVRGEFPRATWVKGLIRGAAEARERAGAPCELYVRHGGEL